MDADAEPAISNATASHPLILDLVLIIFIHGFKGTDTTFAAFPERLRHILSESIENVVVESVVFPAYETKGELSEAVVRFADWLTTLTVQREVANGLEGGATKARVVLCGHSMGGLLAADALIEFAHTRPDKLAPLWPNIIALIAFDTPYLGLHPFVFKNTATQAASYVQTTRSLITSFTSKQTSSTASTSRTSILGPPSASAAASTSVWQKWAPAAYAVGGALIAGAAAGTAYYKRDELEVGYKWATDHMKYVGTLWEEPVLHRRLQDLLEIEEQLGVVFRTFYTFLPPSPPSYPSSRTFVVIPRKPSPLVDHFIRAPNTIAFDEVQAHTGMFDNKTNDGFYELGLSAARIIEEAVSASRKAATDGYDEEVAGEPVVDPVASKSYGVAEDQLHPTPPFTDAVPTSAESEDLLI